MARTVFKREFTKDGGHLTAAEKVVMDESDKQVELASEALDELDDKDVAIIKSHYACQILLNRAAQYFKTLRGQGLVTDREAGEYLEEIEKDIHNLLESGREAVHPDVLSSTQKKARMTTFAQGAAGMSSFEKDVLEPLLDE